MDYVVCACNSQTGFGGSCFQALQVGSPSNETRGRNSIRSKFRQTYQTKRLEKSFLGVPENGLRSPLSARKLARTKKLHGLVIGNGTELQVGFLCARDGSSRPRRRSLHGFPDIVHNAFLDSPLHTFLSRTLIPYGNCKRRLYDAHIGRLESGIGVGDGGELSSMARDFFYQKGILLFRGLAFVGTLLLIGIVTLYGQAKAQSYIENHILPPVASMVGTYLGRSLNLRKVQSVSPLGLTLESCSMGPHAEEFSCGELPSLEIRIRPFASIHRKQIVIDAVLVQPNILVCQKSDWTWLGIPTPTNKSHHRSSTEEGIDLRTKIRRLSRERIALKLAAERDRAACKSARLGYLLKNGQKEEPTTAAGSHSFQATPKNDIISKGTGTRVLDNVYAECTDDTFFGSLNKPKIENSGIQKRFFAGDWFDQERRHTENEEEHNLGTGDDDSLEEKVALGKSLMECKVWLDEHFVKPVRLFKQWSAKHDSQREDIQRRNLDRSAAAALAYFDRINNERPDNGTGWGSDHYKQSAEQQLLTYGDFERKEKDFGIVTEDAFDPYSAPSLSNGVSALDGMLQEEKPASFVQSTSPQVLNGKISGWNKSRMIELEKKLLEDASSNLVDFETPLCTSKNAISDTFPIVNRSFQKALCSEDIEPSIHKPLVQPRRDQHIGGGSLVQEVKVSTWHNEKNGSQHDNGQENYKEKFVTFVGSDRLFDNTLDDLEGRGIESSQSNDSLEYESNMVTPLSYDPSNVPHTEAGVRKGMRGRHSVCFWKSASDFASLSRYSHRLEKSLWPRESRTKWWDLLVKNKDAKHLLVKNKDINEQNMQSRGSFLGLTQAGIGLESKAKAITNKLVADAKRNLSMAPLQKWVPVTLDSVYFKGGTLMLLAYGDQEPRVMKNVSGFMKLGNEYEQVDVQVAGRLSEWKTRESSGDGGRLLVKVYVDIRRQKWHVKLMGNNLYAPLFERLLEIPMAWSAGRANGELRLWASKGDQFPNMAGKLTVKNLGFQILEAPSAFKEVSGTLFFQGQRMFLHNTSGFFGAVPLSVSGDMDLNPESGEYRLVCQVPNVEVNALMKTLKARPPLFPLAGAIKAAVYCRGPLEVPVFAGSAEISKKHVAFYLDAPPSAATEAIRQNEDKGAVAAFDRVPVSYASANFTFDTDNCVADLYGIRATLVDRGEIRGAGNMWICPEGELDLSAVNVDLSGQVFFDTVVRNYLPKNIHVPPMNLDFVHGEAKVRGSLLRPIFDIKWVAPEAKGSFSGARGDINISHEAIVINSSAFTFDLMTKIHTLYTHLPSESEGEIKVFSPSLPPAIEGLELDLRMRAFDFLTLAPQSSLMPAPSTGEMHMKVTGRVRFQGRVVKLLQQGLANDLNKREFQPTTEEKEKAVSGFAGEIFLSGLKLNQFLVAPHLAGSMDIFPRNFKLNATGRADEHLLIECSGDLRSIGLDEISMKNMSSREAVKSLMLFSLQRGQLRTSIHYRPDESAKLEVRNLQLDELELASLRGVVQKAEMLLNFQKRRGQGSLSVRRPRFSGVQGESLDVACRWSGDVITIEKTVLEQARSRYELQGEYVLPGPRDHLKTPKAKGDGMWKSPMAGQLGHLITSMGRWRLRLEVPRAEVADMLPVARLLLRSSDPAVVSRSKEIFMQGMQNVGYSTENLKQQLENVRESKVLPAPDEGSPESIPLPGLAELKGHWHGTFDASGGGHGDTTADFDFYGEEWEWGAYKTQRVVAVGSYGNNDGLHLEKIFIQKDTATLHADGTLLGPKPNLHFAVLNFPVGLLPPLLHAARSSTLQPVPSPTIWAPLTSLKGILYMEGDLRGPLIKPQCDVQVRLLDGAVGGVELGRAEVVASVTSSNRFIFNAKFEPVVRSGHVHVRGSLPLSQQGIDVPEEDETQTEFIKTIRSRGWIRDKTRGAEESDIDEKKLVRDRLGDESWDVHLAESLKGLDGYPTDEGALLVDATVKDGGMMLITALSPYLRWLQGSADLTLQVRGTVDQPSVDGVASFHKVYISSPVLPRPLYNFGGTIRVRNNQLCVDGLDGRVGRKGRLQVKGKLPLKVAETSAGDNIELKADFLEVRAKNIFSGQVDSQIQLTSSLLEPEVSGMIKLSHGEVYLSQEKGANNAASALASRLQGMEDGGNISHFRTPETTSLPEHLLDAPGTEEKVEDKGEQAKPQSRVLLRSLKLELGPELRVVYPLILNFAVTGELELNGQADPYLVRPKGVLNFENGDVNLVATQVRLSRDHANRAKFEPEQGLDPTLDLALIGADWQLKIQGPARNWQDNVVITSTRSGEPDALTRTEAARVFESQLADSLLEGDGQLAFKKLAAATVETLMPKIEGKGEFGQARWRLVSAPQIPNLLSLDPTTDPFKSLANLSFGTEVEVQLGKRLQASVVRQMKESEMATQWTLLYQLNNRLRILFSSIPSVDNRLLVEYSATSQN